MRNIWRIAAAHFAAICLGAAPIALAPGAQASISVSAPPVVPAPPPVAVLPVVPIGGDISLLVRPPCCRPPPGFAAPQYYFVWFPEGVGSLASPEAKNAILRAKDYISASTHGARTAIFASRAGGSARRRLSRTLSLAVAQALVEQDVYPGSIQVFLTRRLPAQCPARAHGPCVVIQIGRMETDFAGH